MITLVWTFGIALGVSLISGKYSFGIEVNRKRIHALCLMTGVSFLGPLSWYVLASPHSYIHRHINYILWSLPCMPLIFALCGYEISCLCHDYKEKIRRWGLLAVLLVGAVVVYFYRDSCKKGNKYINLVQSEGAQIYDGKFADVYYYEDYLYFLIQSGHEKKRIFLHLYPQEGDRTYANASGFVNEDTEFSAGEMQTPFWSQMKISRVTLNRGYGILHIETGQFDETGREWETDFNMADYIEMPEQIVPANLTDSNWQNGVRNDGTVILMKAENEVAIHMLEGKHLKSESGKRMRVEKVEREGNWIHLLLEKPIDVSEGYPHSFQVIDDGTK